MEDFETRINRVETTLERHSERLANIEGKLANDYKSILTLLDDVKNLREQNTQTQKKVDLLEQKVDAFMCKLDKLSEDQRIRDASVNKSLKTLTRWMIFAVVASLAAVIYSSVRNGNTASALTTIAAAVAKMGLL